MKIPVLKPAPEGASAMQGPFEPVAKTTLARVCLLVCKQDHRNGVMITQERTLT